MGLNDGLMGDEVKGVKGCSWFLFTLMDNGVFTGKRCIYMKECLGSQNGVKRVYI